MQNWARKWNEHVTLLRPTLTVHKLQKRKPFLNSFVKSEPNCSQITLRNSTHDLQSLYRHHHSFLKLIIRKLYLDEICDFFFLKLIERFVPFLS
jgi:hypothetical protein